MIQAFLDAEDVLFESNLGYLTLAHPKMKHSSTKGKSWAGLIPGRRWLGRGSIDTVAVVGLAEAAFRASAVAPGSPRPADVARYHRSLPMVISHSQRLRDTLHGSPYRMC